MRNMKKVLLMLLVVIVCINCYAADNVVQQRRNVRKAPVKTASVVNENCMSFMGISFNMSLTNFAKALKAKNFNVVDNTLIFEDYNITGPAFGVENCKVYIYNSDDGINEIYIEKEFASEKAWKEARGNIETYLNKAYPNFQATNYYLVDEKGTCIKYHCRKIGNKNNVHYGNIYITAEVHNEKRFSIKAAIYDNKKYHEYFNRIHSNFDFTKYDISEFAPSSFDQCILDIHDDFLKFTVSINNHTSTFFAFEDDYSYFTNWFFYKETSTAEKKELIKRYLTSFDIDDSNIYECTKQRFKQLAKYYDQEQIRKQKEDWIMKEALLVKSPGEYIFRAIEGLDNIIKYKKDGSYDRRYQMFRKAWNRGVGGSSSSGTNWDGLNDAQKSVIHQNDNAR